MKVKTNELIDDALDWAVTKCEGLNAEALVELAKRVPGRNYGCFLKKYSTDWAQGGPIIDRMQLNRLTTNVGGGYTASVKVTLINTDDDAYMVWTHGSGPTLLIAAMRCRVAFKLGDYVDVPEELV